MSGTRGLSIHVRGGSLVSDSGTIFASLRQNAWRRTLRPSVSPRHGSPSVCTCRHHDYTICWDYKHTLARKQLDCRYPNGNNIAENCNMCSFSESQTWFRTKQPSAWSWRPFGSAQRKHVLCEGVVKTRSELNHPYGIKSPIMMILIRCLLEVRRFTFYS